MEVVNPTGDESEQLAGFDHDARHGDRYERQTVADIGPAAGLSGGYGCSGFCGRRRGALRLITRTLRLLLRLRRAEKAVVLRFLERVSGYSRQQLTRLVKRGGERGPLTKRYHGSRTSFARTYTSADVHLLAATDTLHGTLSGLATKKLMERAYHRFADARYARPSRFRATASKLLR